MGIHVVKGGILKLFSPSLCDHAARIVGRLDPVLLDERVSQDDQLPHDGRQRHLARLSGFPQLQVFVAEVRVVPDRDQGDQPVAGATDPATHAMVRKVLPDGYEELRTRDAREEKYHLIIQAQASADPDCRRLMTIPGIGVLSASALVVKLGDGSEFGNGREVTASIGLVPQQHSTGGKPKLGGISKRGDRSLRELLVLGAHSALRCAGQREDAVSRWACDVQRRPHRNVTAMALAHKNVRIAWTLLRRGGSYREESSMA